MNTDSESVAETLVARAAAWRLASLLLEQPRPQWKCKLVELATEVSDSGLSACVKDANQATEELYHRLFGPGGAVSPREVSYCGFEDPGRVMAELQSFYHAFSFEPQRDEPIDHIIVEAGFVGYLFLKEAYAHMGRDLAAAEITRSARGRFAREHVARCASGMIQRTAEVPPYLRNVLTWLATKGPSL